MDQVRLKNGSIETRLIVNSTMGVLNCMDALCFGALHALCKNPRANISPERKAQLELGGVMSAGRVNESVRNVVLSAMIDSHWTDNNELVLGDPIAS